MCRCPRGVTINVTVNGLPCKEVSLNDTLHIELSKKYRRSEKLILPIRGENNFIFIDENSKTIKIKERDIKLEHQKHEFLIKAFKDGEEEFLNDFKVYYILKNGNLNSEDNEKWTLVEGEIF